MSGPYQLPDGWKWVKLGEVCEIIKGRKPELYDEPKHDKMLPYLTAEVIRFGKKPQWCFELDANSVKVNEDEIIIITDGSNSGEVFSGYKGVLASTMGKLLLDEKRVLKDYLYFFIKMNFESLNQPKRGSAIPHLEKQIFYNLSVPLPPFPNNGVLRKNLKRLWQKSIRQGVLAKNN